MNGVDIDFDAYFAMTRNSYTNELGKVAKIVGLTVTDYLLDGDNVIGEVQNGSVSVSYLRGANLIRKKVGSTLTYYEFI